jgi:hypothetical protein
LPSYSPAPVARRCRWKHRQRVCRRTALSGGWSVIWSDLKGLPAARLTSLIGCETPDRTGRGGGPFGEFVVGRWRGGEYSTKASFGSHLAHLADQLCVEPNGRPVHLFAIARSSPRAKNTECYLIAFAMARSRPTADMCTLDRFAPPQAGTAAPPIGIMGPTGDRSVCLPSYQPI